MDWITHELIGILEVDVNGRTSSATSSLSRRPLSFSRVQPSQIDDGNESECVREAGNIGDRALHSNRHSESASICLFPSEDIQLQSYGFWGRNPVTSTKQFPLSLPCQRKSYLLFPLMRSYTTTKSKS